MKLALTITISALMLAGCASTYNKSAMPNAASGLQLETAICKARWTAKEFKTYSEWQACQLTAERGFARTIALTKMDAFEVYAADVQALAVDRDAHRVTDRQVRSRANDVYTRFLADCGCKPQGQPGTTVGIDFFSRAGFYSSGSALGPYAGDGMPSGNLSQPH